MKQSAFTFRAEWLEAAQALIDPRLVAELLDAIVQYALHGVRPEAPSMEVAALLIVIIPQIEKQRKSEKSVKPDKPRKSDKSNKSDSILPDPTFLTDRDGRVSNTKTNAKRLREYFDKLPTDKPLDPLLTDLGTFVDHHIRDKLEQDKHTYRPSDYAEYQHRVALFVLGCVVNNVRFTHESQIWPTYRMWFNNCVVKSRYYVDYTQFFRMVRRALGPP